MELKSMIRILAIVAFFVGLDSLLVAPLLPVITETISIPDGSGGLLITIYALCYGITAPVLGTMSDRVGRKRMIIIGFTIFSISTFCTGLAKSFEILLLFRGLTGLSGAMIMPSVFALVVDKVTYESRGKAMGTIMGAMVGSTVIGVPIGAFLSEVGNWQWTFYSIGLLTLFLTLLVNRILRNEKQRNNVHVSIAKTLSAPLKMVLVNVSVLFALLATFLWTIGLHGMFSYIGVYYGNNFGLSVGEIGVVIFLAGVGSVAGNILGGKLADKIGKKNVISIASIVTSISVILFSLSIENLVIAITLHIIWSLFIGFGQASLTALISELKPDVRGTVMALNSSAMYIGMTIASGLASLTVSNGFPFSSLGIMCAIASLLVLPIIFVLVKGKALSNKKKMTI
ncbi:MULTISPECIES: MFS transporter [Bacillus]|jgi:multidrug resistance protein|uniref:Multidrug resistance protein, putative n=2 Tax=Bacillus cereus group TaxID=86661 RepID=Q738D2_BACC1|nr:MULTISPECIES: MFS transporter [Bacillus]AAS41380.1 multidrug resistance protein, putative [Bacillus cereus ATCC 10987]KMQ28031.1 MFS transporter [Bacillus cereus]KXY71767.1 MFS transporter [Bacillus cereus]MCU5157706.1 MFS transporter [Bacillus pacificus]MCU9940546.1 MFS transporter [Bacillus pacificus]